MWNFLLAFLNVRYFLILCVKTFCVPSSLCYPVLEVVAVLSTLLVLSELRSSVFLPTSKPCRTVSKNCDVLVFMQVNIEHLPAACLWPSVTNTEDFQKLCGRIFIFHHKGRLKKTSNFSGFFLLFSLASDEEQENVSVTHHQCRSVVFSCSKIDKDLHHYTWLLFH